MEAFNHLDKGDTFTVDHTASEADASRYDGLVLPGGVANPDFLRADEDAVAFVRAFFADAKPVASICHGPWTLIEAGVVNGRTLTSWPSLRTDLRKAGANWVDEEVHVDQGLVTSRNPDDLPAFCAKLVEEFCAGKHEGRRRDRVTRPPAAILDIDARSRATCTWIGEVRPLEGAREPLVELKDRGHAVVLASSAKQQEVDHYIELLDASELADGWTTSADVEQTKPEPDLVKAAVAKAGGGEAVMIGDSIWDFKAAERAGSRRSGCSPAGSPSRSWSTRVRRSCSSGSRICAAGWTKLRSAPFESGG